MSTEYYIREDDYKYGKLGVGSGVITLKRKESDEFSIKVKLDDSQVWTTYSRDVVTYVDLCELVKQF